MIGRFDEYVRAIKKIVKVFANNLWSSTSRIEINYPYVYFEVPHQQFLISIEAMLKYDPKEDVFRVEKFSLVGKDVDYLFMLVGPVIDASILLVNIEKILKMVEEGTYDPNQIDLDFLIATWHEDHERYYNKLLELSSTYK